MATRAKSGNGRAFSRLSDILLNGIDIHRCVAATALGDIAHPGSSAVLKQALLDEDEDVRVDAVSALLKLEDPKIADAVMENLLGDPCSEVKLQAIDLLARLGHGEVVPWLHRMIAGRDEEINWDDAEFYSSGWDDWLDIQMAAIKALGMIGTDESVAVIMAAMENEEGQDLAQFAIPSLAQLGERGIAALGTLYASGDARMRRRVCSVLEQGQSAEMDALLDLCLADTAGEVRLAAITKIIDKNPADERLADFFEDQDADVRMLIVKTIGAKEPDKAMARLGDKSPDVRQTVFRSIAASPDAFEKQGFSESVRKAIAGVPEVAASAAVAWVAMIGKPSAKSLGEALQNQEQPLAFRLGLIEALTLLEDAGLPYLVDAVGDKTRQVRISTLSALAEIASLNKWPNAASDSLLAALHGELVEPVEEANSEEEDAGEDVEAAVVPEQSEPTSTLDRILKDGIRTEAVPDDESEPEEVVLSEEDNRFIEISKLRAMRKGKVSLESKVAPHQDVRRFAACLLGDFKHAGLDRVLGEVLEEQEEDVALIQSCLESLALIGNTRGKLVKRLFGVIHEATQHQDRLVRMYGARCLAYIRGEQVEDVLVELCGDKDVHVRREAILSLGAQKGHGDVLLQALGDQYSGVRSAAARVLCCRHEQLDALIELTLAYDGMHRQEIVAMLKCRNANEAAEKYLDILDDESKKRVWLVAISALGDLFSPPANEDFQAVA